MNEQEIIDENMKYRSTCCALLTSLSFYGWYNFFYMSVTELYQEPYKYETINLISYPYVCVVIVIIYLIYDIWIMIFGKHSKILYRSELLIHHIISLLSCIVGLLRFPEIITNCLMMESLSIFNYVLRSNKNKLTLYCYRFFNLICIRGPFLLYMLYYHHMNHELLFVDVYIITPKITDIIVSVNYIIFIIHDIFLCCKIIYILQHIRNNITINRSEEVIEDKES